MDKKITKFITSHHVMTLASCSGDRPYCCNLFYAYIEQLDSLVFTSSLSTKHGEHMEQNSKVAASIVLETKIVGKIQGLQLEGRAFRPDKELESIARKSYLKAFPYAVVMDLELWVLEIDNAKYTDNKLGFGKKIIWSRC